jgi:GTP cyclohydrolase II
MTHKAERGLFELRQGRALCVTDAARSVCTLVAGVEGLTLERVEQIRSVGGPLRMVVTAHRGRAMGISVAGGQSNVSVALGPGETPDSILALAMERVSAPSPTQWGSPSNTAPGFEARPATATESAGLALVRSGLLLPALVSMEVDPDSAVLRSWIEDGVILDVSSEEVERASARSGIEITSVAEASVPLADAEQSRFVFFREGRSLQEHVAVLIGPREAWPEPVPVRLHSACLTGDLFGSLRCDCGEQLRESLRLFKSRGGGVLVYLAQEGRGIGLGNKLRAYTLQGEGLDTVDADGVLGFGADERLYDAGVAILRNLGITRVELLTNNPHKVAAVEDGGIEVVQRLPLYGGINRHNLRYVQAKVDRSGHWLMDMISQHASAD